MLAGVPGFGRDFSPQFFLLLSLVWLFKNRSNKEKTYERTNRATVWQTSGEARLGWSSALFEYVLRQKRRIVERPHAGQMMEPNACWVTHRCWVWVVIGRIVVVVVVRGASWWWWSNRVWFGWRIVYQPPNMSYCLRGLFRFTGFLSSFFSLPVLAGRGFFVYKDEIV